MENAISIWISIFKSPTQPSALSHTPHQEVDHCSRRFELDLYWLVAVALLPALAILIYNGFQLRRRAIENVREDAVRVISLTGQELASLVEGTRGSCGCSRGRLKSCAMNDTTSRRLREVLKDEPHYTNFGVADAGGKVVSSAVPLAGDFRVNDRSFFAAS